MLKMKKKKIVKNEKKNIYIYFITIFSILSTYINRYIR